jgi:hypothetical protein
VFGDAASVCERVGTVDLPVSRAFDRSGSQREGVDECERGDELIGPGPATGDAEPGAPAAAGDDPGCVQERVAEPFWFGESPWVWRRL